MMNMNAMKELKSPEAMEMIKQCVMRVMKGENYAVEIKNDLIVVAAKSNMMGGALAFGGKREDFGDSPSEIRAKIKEFIAMGIDIMDSVAEAIADEIEKKLLEYEIGKIYDNEYIHDEDEDEDEDFECDGDCENCECYEQEESFDEINDKKNMLEALMKAGLIPNGLGVSVVNPIPNNPHQEIDGKVQSPIEIIEKALGIKLVPMNESKELDVESFAKNYPFNSYVKEKFDPKQKEPKPQRTKIVIDIDNVENLTDSQLLEIIKKIKEK